MRRQRGIPRLLKISLIIGIIIFPFGMLVYSMQRDISTDPPSFTDDVVLPPSNNNTYYSYELGKLPVLSLIFFKLARDSILSSVVPLGYVMLEYELEQFTSGVHGIGYNPAKRSLPVVNTSFWINFTVTHETEYFIVVTSDGDDVPITINLLVWVEITSFLKRELYSILITFSSYYLLISLLSTLFSRYRKKRFRKLLEETRMQEK